MTHFRWLRRGSAHSFEGRTGAGSTGSSSESDDRSMTSITGGGINLLACAVGRSTWNMTKYNGSCLCKAIKFTVEIDLAKATSRCDCSVCAKLRWWGYLTDPSCFTLLSDEAALQSYTVKQPTMDFPFCKVCGIHPFHRGSIPGIMDSFVSVNVACIEADDALKEIRIKYLDGANDKWGAIDEVKFL